MRRITLIWLTLLAACSEQRTPPGVPVVVLGAALTTEHVPHDPDDPAIWVHPKDLLRSIIIGTDKVEKEGALVVFGLDGKIIQTIAPLDRPNNVDVEQTVKLGDQTIDVAIVTERKAHAIRVYSIDPQTRMLSEIARLPVFEGETGEFQEPMGIAIYKRTPDAVFVIVGRKSGPQEGYLRQYRLNAGPSISLVRKFGKYSGSGEIEAIAVDDALGYVYYADEDAGIRKYHADPDRADAAGELAFFGRTGYAGNREGIAIYSGDGGEGYIVSTDQLARNSRYFLYRRQGAPANPHDHSEVVGVLEGSADSTDGIEVTPRELLPIFPRGFLVAMNSRQKNFVLFSWPSLIKSPPSR